MAGGVCCGMRASGVARAVLAAAAAGCGTLPAVGTEVGVLDWVDVSAADGCDDGCDDGTGDADGDGVAAERDCDDADPTKWATGPEHIGGAGPGNDFATLCIGYCTRAVVGDIVLSGIDADELELLSCVEHVHGSLSLSGVWGTADLGELRNLVAVDGDFTVESMSVLESMAGLATWCTWGSSTAFATTPSSARCGGRSRCGAWEP